jgi:hypothetical protein
VRAAAEVSSAIAASDVVIRKSHDVILQFQANAARLPHLKGGEFPSSFFNGFSLGKTPDTSFRKVSFSNRKLLASSYLDRREGRLLKLSAIVSAHIRERPDGITSTHPVLKKKH